MTKSKICNLIILAAFAIIIGFAERTLLLRWHPYEWWYTGEGLRLSVAINSINAIVYFPIFYGMFKTFKTLKN